MIYIVPFLFSFFIGYLALCLIIKTKRLTQPLDFFLSLGLGLGMTSQIIFYSLLFFDKLNRPAVILTHALVLAALFVAKLFSNYPTSLYNAKQNSINPVRLFIFLSPLIICTIILALERPFGGWDAWGAWNWRSNFIFRAGAHWENIFTFETPHHPLFLPSVIVWCWTLLNGEYYIIPLVIGVIFTVSTCGLLIYGLNSRINDKIALLGGAYLLSVPFFMSHGTSQYADIIVAYYLLGCGICLMRALRTGARQHLLLAGLFLGLLGFVKDEGVVASILLFTLTLYYSFKKRLPLRGVVHLMTGFLFIFSSTIFFKLVLVKGSMTLEPSLLLKITAGDSWMTIIKFFGDIVFVYQAWGGFWVLFIFGLIFCLSTIVKSELKIIFYFLVIFVLCVCINYITAPTHVDLHWFLNVTLDRILFQLMPVSLYLIFDTLAYQKQESTRGKVRKS